MRASRRKILVNRSNAQRSTGPRTGVGKSRSKKNSWRHSFSGATHSALLRLPEVKKLADAIAGANPDAARRCVSTIAAEAHLDVLRVQAVRLTMLASKLRDNPAAITDEKQIQDLAAALEDAKRLDRYEQRALARRNRTLYQLSESLTLRAW